jgi:hypothetical protein
MSKSTPKISPFGPYQSFDANIPDEDLKISQKKKFTELVKFLDSKQKEIFLRLILEHAVKYDDFNLNSDTFPYSESSIHNKTQLDFELDREDFPLKLKWILFRFLKVCEKSRKEKLERENEHNEK